jgi:hypothetical protein
MHFGQHFVGNHFGGNHWWKSVVAIGIRAISGILRVARKVSGVLRV